MAGDVSAKATWGWAALLGQHTLCIVSTMSFAARKPLTKGQRLNGRQAFTYDDTNIEVAFKAQIRLPICAWTRCCLAAPVASLPPGGPIFPALPRWRCRDRSTVLIKFFSLAFDTPQARTYRCYAHWAVTSFPRSRAMLQRCRPLVCRMLALQPNATFTVASAHAPASCSPYCSDAADQDRRRVRKQQQHYPAAQMGALYVAQL